MSYEIQVCPVCGNQLYGDYEYGTYCWHEEYGSVYAVTVKVEPQNLAGMMELGRLELREERVDRDWRQAARAVFDKLSPEEQERRRAEAWEGMTLEQRGMHRIIQSPEEQNRRIASWGSSFSVPHEEG